MTNSLLDEMNLDGFWDAKVELELETNERGKRIEAQIDLGPQHQIQEINFTGNLVFSFDELMSTIVDETNLIQGIFRNAIFVRND